MTVDQHKLRPRAAVANSTTTVGRFNNMLSYRRDRAAGCVIVLTKSGRLELGDNIVRIL